MDRRKLKFGLLVVGVVATMAFLLIVTIKSSEGFSYYVTVSEFKSNGATRGDNFRINGKVADGTIERASNGQDVGFVMTDGGATLPVRYHGIVPDTFVDGADVVVEGALRADGTSYETPARPGRRSFATTGIPVDDGMDLAAAAREALLEMLGHLEHEYGFARPAAYALCSAAVDLRVSEAVDVPYPLVSALLPLDVFEAASTADG